MSQEEANNEILYNVNRKKAAKTELNLHYRRAIGTLTKMSLILEKLTRSVNGRYMELNGPGLSDAEEHIDALLENNGVANLKGDVKAVAALRAELEAIEKFLS